MRSVSDLIIDISDRISNPIENEDRWGRTAVIRAMNAVVQEQVTPKLIMEGGEYLVHREVLPLQVGGVLKYPNLHIPMPRRCYGRALREIKYISNQGNGTFRQQDEINVTWCSVSEVDAYETQGFNFNNPMVCIINDYVRLLGNPESANGALVFYYHLEPSDIVDKTTEFATVSNIAWVASTTTFTAAAGTEYAVYQPDLSVKFVDIYRASTGAILKPDVKLTRNGTAYTTTDLSENDVAELKNYQNGGVPVAAPFVSEIYLLPASQSQYSTIPEAFDSILVLETSSRILESLGDAQGLEVVAAMLKKAYDSISVSMGNRLSGQQKRVTDNRTIAAYQRASNYGFRWNRGVR